MARRTRLILVLLAAIGLIVASGLIAAVVFLRGVPATSDVVAAKCVTRAAQANNCLRFPTITGANLPGKSFTLPRDFVDPSTEKQAEYTFVVVPFDEAQQRMALTWLPFAQTLKSEVPTLVYYNVPVFPNISLPVRGLIRTGLNVVIQEEALRALTITVFLQDRDAFLKELDIPNVERIQVMLLNAEGEVLWRGAGPFDEQQGAALRASLNANRTS